MKIDRSLRRLCLVSLGAMWLGLGLGLLGWWEVGVPLVILGGILAAWIGWTVRKAAADRADTSDPPNG